MRRIVQFSSYFGCGITCLTLIECGYLVLAVVAVFRGEPYGAMLYQLFETFCFGIIYSHVSRIVILVIYLGAC